MVTRTRSWPWPRPASFSSQFRQAEHPLGNYVLQDLGRAALDRVRARTQEVVLPIDAIEVVIGAVLELSVRALDVHRELGQRLVGVRPLPLPERALRARYTPLHDLREATVATQSH